MDICARLSINIQCGVIVAIVGASDHTFASFFPRAYVVKFIFISLRWQIGHYLPNGVATLCDTVFCFQRLMAIPFGLSLLLLACDRL